MVLSLQLSADTIHELVRQALLLGFNVIRMSTYIRLSLGIKPNFQNAAVLQCFNL